MKTIAEAKVEATKNYEKVIFQVIRFMDSKGITEVDISANTGIRKSQVKLFLLREKLPRVDQYLLILNYMGRLGIHEF